MDYLFRSFFDFPLLLFLSFFLCVCTGTWRLQDLRVERDGGRERGAVWCGLWVVSGACGMGWGIVRVGYTFDGGKGRVVGGGGARV